MKYATGKKLDLIELSDVFRRHAGFDSKDGLKRQQAKFYVEAARRVAVLCTYYLHEYPGFERNFDLDRDIAGEIRKIADRAQKDGLTEVVLPILQNRYDRNAVRIGAVLKMTSLPIKVTLREKPYTRNMSAYGPVDGGIRTAVDPKLRGLTAVRPDLWMKWDRL